ncbi:MAG: type II secretion system F family protein [Bacilli bacterium]|nr:type II secretion system F family protein [Bacilli bacterium]
MDFIDIIKILTIVLSLAIIIFIIRLEFVSKLDKRISNYTFNYNQSNLSIIDSLIYLYNFMSNKLGIFLNKTLFFKKYFIKRSISPKEKDILDTYIIFSKKIVLSIVFLILGIVILSLNNNSNLLYLIVFLIIGYKYLDIYNYFHIKKVNKEIAISLEQAIAILNNAFKSGKNITEAVLDVCNQLDGHIKEEFNKIYKDISFGLGIEEAFIRFSKRINIKEVKYISTSICILNKTGGNYANIFNIIEENYMNNMKIESEKKALIASSIFLSRLLILMPILIIVLISLINYSYFSILFTNIIGLFIIFIILLLYILYIFIINKIMKVGDL